MRSAHHYGDIERYNLAKSRTLLRKRTTHIPSFRATQRPLAHMFTASPGLAWPVTTTHTCSTRPEPPWGRSRSLYYPISPISHLRLCTPPKPLPSPNRRQSCSPPAQPPGSDGRRRQACRPNAQHKDLDAHHTLARNFARLASAGPRLLQVSAP